LVLGGKPIAKVVVAEKANVQTVANFYANISTCNRFAVHANPLNALS
jgi:hypothetical protein